MRFLKNPSYQKRVETGSPRQNSQPVFLAAKSLILLAQKSQFAAQMYSALAQFFKANSTGSGHLDATQTHL